MNPPTAESTLKRFWSGSETLGLTQSILVLHPSCHQTTTLGPFFAASGEGLVGTTRRDLLRRARNS